MEPFRLATAIPTIPDADDADTVTLSAPQLAALWAIVQEMREYIETQQERCSIE